MSIYSMRACAWKAIIDKLNQDGPVELTKEERDKLKEVCESNMKHLTELRNLKFLDLYNNLDPIRDTSKFAICDSLGSFDGILMIGEHPVATHGYVFNEKAVRKAQATCSKSIEPTTCKENVATYFRELDSMDVSPSKESLEVIAKFKEDLKRRKAYIEKLIEEERRDIVILGAGSKIGLKPAMARAAAMVSLGTTGIIESETYEGTAVKGMDFSDASRKHKAQSYKQRRGKGDRKRDRDPMYANMFKRR